MAQIHDTTGFAEVLQEISESGNPLLTMLVQYIVFDDAADDLPGDDGTGGQPATQRGSKSADRGTNRVSERIPGTEVGHKAGNVESGCSKGT